MQVQYRKGHRSDYTSLFAIPKCRKELSTYTVGCDNTVSVPGNDGAGFAAFSCGRAVQLGMELKQSEIVHPLLSSGADIDLEQPVWDIAGHKCGFMSRVAYQRVIHGLHKISS
jgi:hypothetical protein